MEEKEKNPNELNEANGHHREMTEERKLRRKRILKGVVAGTIIVAVAGTGIWFIAEVFRSAVQSSVVGGAMGQWEEIPMQSEDCAIKLENLMRE